MDSVPIVAITGNVTRALLGKDSFQEVDIAGVTMPVVKHNWIVKDVNDLAEIVREAFIVAGSGRPGPVLIDIPKDITAMEAEWPGTYEAPSKTENGLPGLPILGARAWRLSQRNMRQTFSDADIKCAVTMLSEAKRPTLYAGGGVIISGASAELGELATRLNAPVCLSLMGQGALPYNHAQYTGLAGMHGSVASNKAIQKADLLVAIGARFSDRVTSATNQFATKAQVLQFDIDPAEINKNIKVKASVVGNIREILRRVLEELPVKSETDWFKDIQAWKNKIPHAHNRKTALSPRFIIKETAAALGENAIVVTDVGQHQMWTAQFYPFSKPRSFLSSGGLGTMGFGLGAAEGAKVANPERPVVLFTGDGCFRMNCAELGTLGAYHLPILIVIFSNGVLGMVRQWQTIFYEGRYSETNLDRPPDFVKLAEAYNVAGFRAASEAAFSTALAAAMDELARGRPAVIDALIDKDERVLPMVPGGKPIDQQILS
jgi:acetolactate synthase-1/2/3 large subunit